MAGKEQKKRYSHKAKTIDGIVIAGNLNLDGGDFIGHDERISTGEKSVVISGNVSKSAVIVGNSIIDNIQNIFSEYYKFIEQAPLPLQEKSDILADVKEIQAEIEKGEQASESLLARRLRNIGRMAPDILDVILATFSNPVSGLSMVAKKVADKVRETSN